MGASANITEREGPCLPVAVWFLFSEDDEPRGQVYRGNEDAIPTLGTRLTDGKKWKIAEVVRFEELRASCGMRRFRVVVRVVQ